LFFSICFSFSLFLQIKTIFLQKFKTPAWLCYKTSVCIIKGVDIYPLKQFGAPLMGYRKDSQRYMDLHYSAYDTFDKVHIRELQLGSGCMTAIIFLIDKYGF